MPKSRPNPLLSKTLRNKCQGRWGYPLLAALAFVATTSAACAQWDIEDSGTKASLRGIHSVGGGVAWASGTNGTVIRTEDGGYLWQGCAIPPGAEKLDFRGIQAFDEQTAIVMSSGPGDQSRLYKTTDGCRSWKLVFTNPDAPQGFFDTVLFLDKVRGLVLGDPAQAGETNPVGGSYKTFRIRVTRDGGNTWAPVTDPETTPGKNLVPRGDEGLFAASNSSAGIDDGWLWIGTGDGRVLRRRLYSSVGERENLFTDAICAGRQDPYSGSCGHAWMDWDTASTPLSSTDPAAGIFSLVFQTAQRGVVVGGNYKAPEARERTAASTIDGGQHWTAAVTPPHGYRSSVAYDPAHHTWITVGPNGTDISRDDGKNWTALKPLPGEPPDTDQHWNALSLPFVVGPDGRIGKLRSDALDSHPATKGQPPPPHP